MLERKEKTKLNAGLSPSDYHWICTGSFLRGVIYCYSILQHEAVVNLYIDCRDATANKGMFDELHAHKHEIEQAFEDPIFWQRLDEKRGCRIGFKLTGGGYLDDEEHWPAIQEAMVSAMIKFERAIAPLIATLKH